MISKSNWDIMEVLKEEHSDAEGHGAVVPETVVCKMLKYNALS